MSCKTWRLSAGLSVELLKLAQAPFEAGIGGLGAAFGHFDAEQGIDAHPECGRERGQQVSWRVRSRSFVVSHHALRDLDLGGQRRLRDPSSSVSALAAHLNAKDCWCGTLRTVF